MTKNSNQGGGSCLNLFLVPVLVSSGVEAAGRYRPGTCSPERVGWGRGVGGPKRFVDGRGGGRLVVSKRECSAREPVDLGVTACQPVQLQAFQFEAVREAQMLLSSIQFRPSVVETVSKQLAGGLLACLHRRGNSVAGSMTRASLQRERVAAEEDRSSKFKINNSRAQQQ